MKSYIYGLFAVAALVVGGSAQAQDKTPQINCATVWGMVKDSIGTPMPGVRMDIVRSETGDTVLTLVTNDKGYFATNLLKPGEVYIADAAKTGYQEMISKKFIPSTDTTRQLNFVMPKVKEKMVAEAKSKRPQISKDPFSSGITIWMQKERE